MRKKILVATRNPGKLKEFQRLLAHLDMDVIDLDLAGIQEEVEETGSTFEENARLKAETYGKLSGILTLADDSGLEVDALDGRPGVMSARYGGPGLSDEQRVEKLLEEMEEVRGWDRQARFKSVIALSNTGATVTEEGAIEGAIAHQAIGENGFGYDPVFWLASRAKTTAELSGEEKDAVSHRGVALRKMIPQIEQALK